ncbi:PIG-L deacetylase family protein [Stackebrandtia nassauensis]|uniref:LmbE family protein n=1 Tax=Stackebrandtia nassauensis (strain DSM 44728 / CIP 108903 / NRRL B-16338 / NBRC 102104 / LLR-40K-21) TaxID=446470 RepID=D3Q3R6_STANL|nr:PIG-L deacetylase family protein [Stackebrandtia nassauensis]ADD43983.1 LmbE family protein [Stackebrandtia nassauensis DSM 44728]
MSSNAPLEEFPEDGWSRVLAVVAHPDDLEYGAAGAIARWTRMGREVAYLLASKGEAGMDDTPPETAGPLRVQEQIESAAVVGVTDVEFLDHPDGLIEHTVELRRDIAAAIRRHRPDIIVTINHHPHWGPGFLNMADHRNLGNAVFDAVRDASNRWLFTDLGLEPWSGVQKVLVAGSPNATHAVDITDTLDAAIESLSKHAAYLTSLGDHGMSDPEEFLTTMALQTGQRFGARRATSFEVFNM